MARLATLSDDDLGARIRHLRREQMRRAGKSHTCVWCGASFIARANARYCSGACRVATFRAKAATTPVPEGGDR